MGDMADEFSEQKWLDEAPTETPKNVIEASTLYWKIYDAGSAYVPATRRAAYAKSCERQAVIVEALIEAKVLEGRNPWNEFGNDDKSSYPPLHEKVLCRLVWDSGKVTHSVLYRVAEDDVFWRCGDDNMETSYSISVTHWQRIAELKKEQL